jgi:hypothetical protein
VARADLAVQTASFYLENILSELNQNPDLEKNVFLKLPTQTQSLIIGLGFVLALVVVLIVRGLLSGEEDGFDLGEVVS